MLDHQDLLTFAFEAVNEAGKECLPYFRQSTAVENKAGAGLFDPVTAADRAVERALRDAIQARFPDHGILGEEYGVENANNEYVWVIDPIDGTRAFISGFPAWGVLLGLQHKGRGVVGVMHQPYLRETFISHLDPSAADISSGEDKAGAWLMRDRFSKKSPIRVSSVAELSRATIYCTHPEIFPEADGSFEAFRRVADQCQLMRYGGDCYSYALLAMGQVDLVVEAGLQAYDILPLIPLIEAAGGVVTNWRGGRIDGASDVVAASTAALHAAALESLAQE